RRRRPPGRRGTGAAARALRPQPGAAVAAHRAPQRGEIALGELGAGRHAPEVSDHRVQRRGDPLVSPFAVCHTARNVARAREPETATGTDLRPVRPQIATNGATAFAPRRPAAGRVALR